MSELFAHLMITAVMAIIAMTVIEFMNFLLKRRILKSGQVDDKHLQLLTRQQSKHAVLKWGIIFVVSGIGLVVNGLLPFNPETSPIPWGIEVIFIGLGFLLYYLLVRKSDQP